MACCTSSAAVGAAGSGGGRRGSRASRAASAPRSRASGCGHRRSASRKARTAAGIDIAGDEALADAARQDEGQGAARDLLVLRDQLHQPVGVRQLAGNVGDAGRQADGLRDARRRASRPPARTGPGWRRSGTPAPCRPPPPRHAAGGRRSRHRPPAHGRRCGRGSGARGRRSPSRRGRRRRPWRRSWWRWPRCAPGRRRTPRPICAPARRRTAHCRSARTSPPRHSRSGTGASGSVSSTSVSAMTRIGWWKAPIRFLPSGELMPVLPPTEESTCASRLVGTCTKSTPRRSAAAAKPARSPTTPPPSASTRSRRSMRAAMQFVQHLAEGVEALGALAGLHGDDARRQPGRLQRGDDGGQMALGDILVGDDADPRAGAQRGRCARRTP